MRKSLPGLVRRLSLRNFYTAKAYYRLRLYLSSAKGQESILVYQMGKVGSTTVLRSLRALGLDMSIHHVHMLTREGISRYEAFIKENFFRKSVSAIVENLVLVKYLRKQLDHTGSDQRWKVVTLVRDPVARNISSFFEILDLQMNYGLQDKLEARTIDNVVEDLCKFFIDEYPDHDLPLTFFDSELKSVFGVNVFINPFPKSKGYKIYEGEKVEILLLRIEDLDRCARDAFEKFLGVKKIEVITSRTGSEKNYSDVYRRFLGSINLPDSYLKKMYRSKYATHFYSKEEITKFEARWRTQAVT